MNSIEKTALGLGVVGIFILVCIILLFSLYPIAFFCANVLHTPWWTFNFYACVIGSLVLLGGGTITILK